MYSSPSPKRQSDLVFLPLVSTWKRPQQNDYLVRLLEQNWNHDFINITLFSFNNSKQPTIL